MKKILFTAFVNLLFLQFTIAQQKPELPPNYYDSYSYNLPAGFNYNDPAQLSNEVAKISAGLLKLQNDVFNNYSIADSNNLYYTTADASDVDIYFKQYQQGIDKILRARSIRPVPVYSSPLSLVRLAYAKACILHADDESEAFRKIFTTQLVEQYNTLNTDFKNDIVNQSKGSYNAASIELWWKNLQNLLDQAINNTGGKLSFDVANSLFFTYQNYQLRKIYQPQIENALYTVSPSRVEEQVVKIPMRDGIKLNAYVYKDVVNTSKLPAIILLSPYPGGSEATRGNVFATNGYIYVYVDSRGRRASEGNFMPYEDDARDYYDIIDWVSKQEWCDGQVATSGGSYLGFDQWQAVRKQYKHPALKAINPMVAVGFGVDFPRISNKFYNYILQWATFISGKELNQPLFNDWQFWDSKNYELYKKRLPFAKLDSVAGMPNPIFQTWVSHPDFDSYWQNILPSKKDYESIDIPILSITGYYDDDQVGAMYYYDNHQRYGNAKAKSEHYLLIGPYNHGGAQWQPGAIQAGKAIEAEAQIPIYKYVIWWFDWKLKGKAKPSFIKDKVTYFETGNNSWKGTSSLKELSNDSLSLYLNPFVVANAKRKDLHGLSLKKSAPGSLSYRHDISMALDSMYLYGPAKPFDDSIYMTSPYNLVFESSPLEKDIILTDKIEGRIFMTLNVPDADFEINVQEVDADGKSRNIANGSVRVRYRNGGDKPQLAKPNEVVELSFPDIYIYIKKINKGSKIRLIFQSINNPWSEKNYGFGTEVSKESTTSPRIIEAKILTGGKYASKLVLPVHK